MTYNVFSGTLNPTHFTSPQLEEMTPTMENQAMALSFLHPPLDS